nr:hypothetical protein [Tawny frogmouth aviadenovirus A]
MAESAMQTATAVEEEKPPSDLYLSVIMTPVPYPKCFAALTPIYETLERNYLDVQPVSIALGQFLNNKTINTLYIYGEVDTNAWPFFQDMRAALEGEEELDFCSCIEEVEMSEKQKQVVFLSKYDYDIPTPSEKYWAIPLLTNKPYTHFTREDLASLVACGNAKGGPNPKYACRSEQRMLCVRRRFIDKRTCGVCFKKPLRMRLEYPDRLNPAKDLPLLDVGIVTEPLGIPRELYARVLSDTESDSFSEDSDADY